MKQFSGVFSQVDYETANLIRKVMSQVSHGASFSYSEKELHELIAERYFGFEPIVSLTEQEEQELRNALKEELQYTFAESSFSEFINSVCYLLPDPNGDFNIYQDSAVKEAGLKPRTGPMSTEEKIALLEKTSNSKIVWHAGHSISNGFERMGYRNFMYYPICSRFQEIIGGLKLANGDRALHILDLGGGNGRALNDIKMEHPELITYNATRDEEFIYYPADFQVIACMERIPLALKGTIDLIFSNMATRYFAFTDLVIEGCVAMLAKGGIMDVFFSSERSDNHSEEDVMRRMKKAHDFLKEMESSGVIELKIDNSFTSNIGGSFQSGEGTLYPAASVFVRKLM
ncbi:hypothetical protein C4565_02465 [Candidatus Parcubacteria bacterium]|jgi:hypothetical protein|nr:MAG: hypothetical protein C4565_02465 [Candidatus Parcubacteria bacterium]